MSTTWEPPTRTMAFDEFLGLLSGHLSIALEGAAPEHRLVDDLGLDSIALFELVVLLEDTAGHDLPLELVDSVETLADAWHWYTTVSGTDDDT
jgi:acyl carrier protein